jgi:hypothetical protein
VLANDHAHGWLIRRGWKFDGTSYYAGNQAITPEDRNGAPTPEKKQAAERTGRWVLWVRDRDTNRARPVAGFTGLSQTADHVMP